MTWPVSSWVAAALLALCTGQSAVHEGNWLSTTGYHLCTRNESRNLSFLVVREVPYTVTKPCGGLLVWWTCTVTVTKMVPQTEYRTVWEQVPRCCDGYVQAGRYCVLSVNRSGEFTAKPGSCPNADGADPRSEACWMDIDCPGWQKCCKICGRSLCVDPANAANYPLNGGNRLNATVTVKTDYQRLITEKERLLDHVNLLYTMVSGALQSEAAAIYYLSSWPVFPFRSATSLLIDYRLPLSVHNVTAQLHLLLKRIVEVSSVTVRDIDECAHPALRRCSLLAHCNNTEGSYRCDCRQGYVDVDSSNPGANCTADVSESATTEGPLPTGHPPMNTAPTSASSTTWAPTGGSSSGTASISNSSEGSVTTALSNVSSFSVDSSQAPLWTSSTPQPSTSSAAETPRPTDTCPPPSISRMWTANVTGSSFSVCWSSHQTNQTYWVVISSRSEVIFSRETNQTMVTVRTLEAGSLYNVTVTPCACGYQGEARHVSVKTDAQALDATARLTNIQFTTDLHNTSTQAYKNLAGNITEEIYQSLSPAVRAMVDAGRVRIQIRGFSRGSVVVNFTLVFTSTLSQRNISDVSTAVLHSLMKSSKYRVDENNTSIDDFDECVPGENDCSQWASCTNTWASYSCACLDGFRDTSPERPGRACQAIATMETTMLALTLSSLPVTQTTSLASEPATVTPVTTARTIPAVVAKGDSGPTTVPTPTPTPSVTASTNTTTAQTTKAISTTTQINRTTAPTTTTASTISNVTATTVTTIARTTTSTSIAATNSALIMTTALTNTNTTSVPINNTSSATITPVRAATTRSASTSHTTPTITATASVTMTASTSTIEMTSSTINTDSTTAKASPTPTTSTTTNSTIPVIKTTHLTSTIVHVTTSSTIKTSASPQNTSNVIPANATTAPTSMSVSKATGTTTTTSVNPITTHAPVTTSSPSSTPTIPPMKASTAAEAPTTIAALPTTGTPVSRSPATRSLQGDLSVQCRVAAITVTISKDFLLSANIQESALYLGLLACGVNADNGTHIQLTVAWDECDTRLVHNETYYTASVTLFNNMDPYTAPGGDVKVPKLRLEVPIMCTYMKSKLISADFGSTGYDMVQEIITGLGSFQVRVQLMNGTVPLPHNYSLSPQEAVVVQVSLNTSLEQLKLVINKCWATPTRSPIDANSFVFLENSCSLNSFTKVLRNGNSSTSHVSVQIFAIVDADMIYLHCQVQICLQTGAESCVPDCGQRTARSGKTVGRSFASVGPIFIEEDESLSEGLSILQIAGFSCLGVGLSLFFIIGFVCLFFYQRNRIGHYNFSAKPKEENFTYLVFNT